MTTKQDVAAALLEAMKNPSLSQVEFAELQERVRQLQE